MSNSPDSNGELLNRLREGDEGALAELFSEYRERLKRIVLVRMDRRLRGRADASDVLQEAYIDAQQRLRHFIARPELPFFAWLRQVTIQRLIDTHRHHLGAQMRDARHDVSIDRTASDEMSSASLAIQLVGHLTSPSHTALRAELIEQVEIGLRQMAPIDREVLVLRHFEELTNNEVAAILGITKAAASNRYIRALSRFRNILAEVPGLLDDSCVDCRTRHPAAVSDDRPT